MKRFLAIISVALALTAISCQRIGENLQNGPVVITASIDQQLTRVSYEENASHNLVQTWEVDDELIGVDDEYNRIVMRVTSVDGNGVATLELTEGALPATGSIHMLYGYKGNNWPSYLTIGSQSFGSGEKVPAFLTADAAVTGSSINLTFTNQTAILGIKGFHGLPASAEIKRFSISDVFSDAILSISEGITTIDACGHGAIVLSKYGFWAADASGEVDDIFYVAVFPSDQEYPIRIQAELKDGSFYCNDLGNKTIAAAKYYYMNNKELRQAVAFVDYAPCYTIEDAFATANASDGCTLKLVSDCTASGDLSLTNTSGLIVLDLNGHTLDMNGHSLNVDAAGGRITIQDLGATAGSLLQTGNSSLLYVTNGTLTIRRVRCECSAGRILRIAGGEVNIKDGTHFVCAQPSLYLMYVENGTLNIDGGEFDHTSASAFQHIYTQTGTPTINITGGVFRGAQTSYNMFAFTTAAEVNIGGDAVFINTGTQNTFNFQLPANSNNVHITGGYYTNSKAFYSKNSNVVTLSGGYFRSSSLTVTNCSYKASHSNRNVYPSVSKEGYTFGYRISHNSLHRWSFTIGNGEVAYPAQYNCKYTPSTTTWAFQSSYENYTSGYNADEVNLFTWGLPSEYTNPASTTGRTGSQSLEPEEDWGYYMPSDGLFTLTKEQWDYLLNTRSASTVNGVANARYMKCTIQDSPGLLIFPDNFTWPANAGAEATASGINDPNASFSLTYYRSPAGYLIAAGCIFLRADGYRNGTSASNCGTAGYYWTSTSYSSGQPWYLYFNASTLSLEHSDDLTIGKGAAVRVFSK